MRPRVQLTFSPSNRDHPVEPPPPAKYLEPTDAVSGDVVPATVAAMPTDAPASTCPPQISSLVGL
jgi:hypothetical protein